MLAGCRNFRRFDKQTAETAKRPDSRDNPKSRMVLPIRRIVPGIAQQLLAFDGPTLLRLCPNRGESERLRQAIGRGQRALPKVRQTRTPSGHLTESQEHFHFVTV